MRQFSLAIDFFFRFLNLNHSIQHLAQRVKAPRFPPFIDASCLIFDSLSPDGVRVPVRVLLEPVGIRTPDDDVLDVAPSERRVRFEEEGHDAAAHGRGGRGAGKPDGGKKALS